MSRSISASDALRRALGGLGVAVLALAAGCSGDEFTDIEKATIASLSLDALPPLPSDPSNRVADHRLAAAFGATLFFEPRLSGHGDVSCSTCHQIDRQFQDDRPLGRAVGLTDRRTMPLAGVAWSPWQFWDGRKDSLWAQALGPLEDAREHGGNRTAYAHFITASLKNRYERIFGPLPDLSDVPQNAGPLGSAEERAAWETISETKRAEIDTVFANIGKSIAAFERSIRHEETRFDRFARAIAAGETPQGDAALDETERLGLKLFIGRANCVTCHAGPRFSDEHFHNTGVPQPPELPEDSGRAAGIAKALADPFNCLGRYSDAKPEQCGELRFVAKDDHAMLRAFKTPSLRGAVSRPPYMHSGQIATIEDVVDHYAAAPTPPKGESELKPLTLSEREKQALVAFLKTLDSGTSPAN
jgi:cytochrome c peroxidase